MFILLECQAIKHQQQYVRNLRLGMGLLAEP